jgi:cytochrome c
MARFLTHMMAAALCVAEASAGKAADAVKGQRVFQSQCSICHSIARSGVTVIGPTLFAVVGRKAGAIKGYTYSKAMLGSGVVWSKDKLRVYLPQPQKTIPGIKMTYPGLKDSGKLDDLIEFLATSKP